MWHGSEMSVSVAKPDVIVHARDEESVKKKINKKVAVKCKFTKMQKYKNTKLQM